MGASFSYAPDSCRLGLAGYPLAVAGCVRRILATMRSVEVIRSCVARMDFISSDSLWRGGGAPVLVHRRVPGMSIKTNGWCRNPKPGALRALKARPTQCKLLRIGPRTSQSQLIEVSNWLAVAGDTVPDFERAMNCLELCAISAPVLALRLAPDPVEERRTEVFQGTPAAGGAAGTRALNRMKPTSMVSAARDKDYVELRQEER